MTLLKDMTLEELQALYKVNQFLRNQVAEEASEQVNFWIDEYLNHFRGIRALDYCIGYPGDYFTFLTHKAQADDYREFFEACEESRTTFYLFSEKTAERLKRGAEKLEFYIDAWTGYEDMSDSRFDHLEKWINGIIKDACAEILQTLKDEYNEQFDAEYLMNIALDLFAENQGGDYETDGIRIYETSVRSYA